MDDREFKVRHQIDDFSEVHDGAIVEARLTSASASAAAALPSLPFAASAAHSHSHSHSLLHAHTHAHAPAPVSPLSTLAVDEGSLSLKRELEAVKKQLSELQALPTSTKKRRSACVSASAFLPPC